MQITLNYMDSVDKSFSFFILGALCASLFFGVVGLGFFITRPQPAGASILENPSFNIASSTSYSIGHQLSMKVLDRRGNRTWASLCNIGSSTAYLFFATTTEHSYTAQTATSSASRSIATNQCFETPQDSRFTGEVHAMHTGATTTRGLIVTEFLIQ